MLFDQPYGNLKTLLKTYTGEDLQVYLEGFVESSDWIHDCRFLFYLDDVDDDNDRPKHKRKILKFDDENDDDCNVAEDDVYGDEDKPKYVRRISDNDSADDDDDDIEVDDDDNVAAADDDVYVDDVKPKYICRISDGENADDDNVCIADDKPKHVHRISDDNDDDVDEETSSIGSFSVDSKENENLSSCCFSITVNATLAQPGNGYLEFHQLENSKVTWKSLSSCITESDFPERRRCFLRNHLDQVDFSDVNTAVDVLLCFEIARRVETEHYPITRRETEKAIDAVMTLEGNHYQQQVIS